MYSSTHYNYAAPKFSKARIKNQPDFISWVNVIRKLEQILRSMDMKSVRKKNIDDGKTRLNGTKLPIVFAANLQCKHNEKKYVEQSALDKLRMMQDGEPQKPRDRWEKSTTEQSLDHRKRENRMNDL